MERRNVQSVPASHDDYGGCRLSQAEFSDRETATSETVLGPGGVFRTRMRTNEICIKVIASELAAFGSGPPNRWSWI